MKKKIKASFFLTALILSAGFYTSCSKIPGITKQDITWKGVDASATVPVVTDTVLHLSMGTGSFTYNLDSMIKDQSKGLFDITKISKVSLNKCVLTISNPDQANNFANFKMCAVYVNTSINPATVQMATIENNPDVYAETLELPVDKNADLKSYLYSPGNTSNSTTFNYVVGGQLRRATTKPMDVTAHIEYTVSLGN